MFALFICCFAEKALFYFHAMHRKQKWNARFSFGLRNVEVILKTRNWFAHLIAWPKPEIPKPKWEAQPIFRTWKSYVSLGPTSTSATPLWYRMITSYNISIHFIQKNAREGMRSYFHMLHVMEEALIREVRIALYHYRLSGQRLMTIIFELLKYFQHLQHQTKCF